MVLQIKLAMLPLICYIDLQLSLLSLDGHPRLDTQHEGWALISLLWVSHWLDDDGSWITIFFGFFKYTSARWRPWNHLNEEELCWFPGVVSCEFIHFYLTSCWLWGTAGDELKHYTNIPLLAKTKNKPKPLPKECNMSHVLSLFRLVTNFQIVFSNVIT